MSIVRSHLAQIHVHSHRILVRGHHYMPLDATLLSQRLGKASYIAAESEKGLAQRLTEAMKALQP